MVSHMTTPMPVKNSEYTASLISRENILVAKSIFHFSSEFSVFVLGIRIFFYTWGISNMQSDFQWFLLFQWVTKSRDCTTQILRFTFRLNSDQRAKCHREILCLVKIIWRLTVCATIARGGHRWFGWGIPSVISGARIRRIILFINFGVIVKVTLHFYLFIITVLVKAKMNYV